MAGKFSVTASNLRTIAEQLSTLNGNLKREVISLEESEGSLNTMWEGEAKNAFHNAFTTDKGQMDAFTALIDKYSETLNNIAKSYADAEARNVETATNRTA